MALGVWIGHPGRVDVNLATDPFEATIFLDGQVLYAPDGSPLGPALHYRRQTDEMGQQFELPILQFELWVRRTSLGRNASCVNNARVASFWAPRGR